MKTKKNKKEGKVAEGAAAAESYSYFGIDVYTVDGGSSFLQISTFSAKYLVLHPRWP
jgi:hypothetical protein